MEEQLPRPAAAAEQSFAGQAQQEQQVPRCVLPESLATSHVQCPDLQPSPLPGTLQRRPPSAA